MSRAGSSTRRATSGCSSRATLRGGRTVTCVLRPRRLDCCASMRRLPASLTCRRSGRWDFSNRTGRWTAASKSSKRRGRFAAKKLPCDALIYLGTGFCPSGWNTGHGSFAFPNQAVFPGARGDAARVS